LDDAGKLDAQMAGQKLKFYKPKIIYSSDLVRDTQTATIIAGICGNIPMKRTLDFALPMLALYRECPRRMRVTASCAGIRIPANLRPVENPSIISHDGFGKRTNQSWSYRAKRRHSVQVFSPRTGAILPISIPITRAFAPEEALMPIPGGIAVVRSNEDGVDRLNFSALRRKSSVMSEPVKIVFGIPSTYERNGWHSFRASHSSLPICHFRPATLSHGADQ